MLRKNFSVLLLTALMFALVGIMLFHRDKFDLPYWELRPLTVDPHDQIVGDPEAYGRQLAQADIAKGEIHYYLYGLRYDNPQEKIQRLLSDIKITFVLRGCEIGSLDYDRDAAYNKAINSWLDKHYGFSVSKQSIGII